MIRHLKYITILIALLLLHLLSNAQKTILWKVTDTLSGRVSYLLGTCHQFGNSFVDSLPSIKQCLYKSDLVIFEALDDNGKIVESINNRSTTKIRKRLGKKLYNELIKIAGGWRADVHKLKPVEVRWKLEQKYAQQKCEMVKDIDEWDHFDNYLQFLARKQKIELLGLETYEEQLNFIEKDNNSPKWKQEKKNIKYLIHLFKSHDVNESKCKLANEFRTMSFDYQFSNECPNDVLLKERNANWMEQLPRLLRKNNCFVAVGLYHLYRQCGLIIQLRNHGFTVEPVTLK